MTRLTDDEFDAELSKINDLIRQCLPILITEIARLYAVERDIRDREDFDKLLAELDYLDARTNDTMASRLSRRPSRRKQKKRSQNCGANTRALVSSTGKREGPKFACHWP